jgi:hypothetical protein
MKIGGMLVRLFGGSSLEESSPDQLF